MQIIPFTHFSPIHKKKTKHEYFLPYDKLNFFINPQMREIFLQRYWMKWVLGTH